MSLHKKNGGSVGSLVSNADQVVSLLGIDNDEVRDVIQSAALQDPRGYMSLRNNIIYGKAFKGIADSALVKYTISTTKTKDDEIEKEIYPKSIKGNVVDQGNKILSAVDTISDTDYNKNAVASNLPPYSTFMSLPSSVKKDLTSQAIEETFNNRVRKFNQMFPPTFNTRKTDKDGYSLEPNNKALGLMSMK